jgi:transcriptional regulator with XRE-family HTH domain|tara:strand:+ start:315 stop:545 length:231 start_codon:yes stop_codon:yes gene_type:complete
VEARDILARNLRILRRTKGWSQEELADRAQIDRTYVSALERCVYAASVDVLDRLAKALSVSVAALFDTDTADSVEP